MGSPPAEALVIRPRTKTMLRPAFTTSPRHSTRSPSRAVPTSSQLKVAVTLLLALDGVAGDPEQAEVGEGHHAAAMHEQAAVHVLASARKAPTRAPSGSTRQ